MKRLVSILSSLACVLILAQGCASVSTDSSMQRKRYRKSADEAVAPPAVVIASRAQLPQLVAPVPVGVQMLAKDAADRNKKREAKEMAEKAANEQKKAEKKAPSRRTVSIEEVEKQEIAEPRENVQKVEKPDSSTVDHVSVLPSSKAYRVRSSDNIVVALRGIPQPDQIEDIIDEEGYITLPYIGSISAAGKTCSQLERDIRDAYVEGQIYKNVQVIVAVPTHSYYIRGEVKRPSRYPLDSSTTMMKALATAGGYTEFADQKDIKILRGDQVIKVNMKEIERNPQIDTQIQMGDVIVVGRSWL